MDLLALAVPFFLLALIIELIVDWRKGTGLYRSADAINSLSAGTLSTTFGYFTKFLPVYQALAEQIKTLTNDRVRLHQQQIEIRNMNSDQPVEFTVIQQAAPAFTDRKSNAKKLVAGTMGACLLVLIGPLALREMLRSGAPEAQTSEA